MKSNSPFLLTRFTARVHRPVNDVFALISNHENYQHWYPGAVSVTSLDDTPHGLPGKSYLETLRLPSGRTIDIRIMVVESNAPTDFVTEGDYSPLLPQMRFALEAIGEDETHITWSFHSRQTSPVRRTVIRLLFRPILKRQCAEAMSRLTHMLEQPAGVSPPPAPVSR